MRFTISSLLVFISLTILAQEQKSIRPLNVPEFQELKSQLESLENLLVINQIDTVYEHQRNFNMKNTPALLYNSKIQVWNERDSANDGFVPFFDYAKYDKNSGKFGYAVRLLVNPLRKPTVIYDQLRKFYYFEIPVKQKESWSIIGTRIDTVLTEKEGFTKYKIDSVGNEVVSSDTAEIVIDTSLVEVPDTINLSQETDKIFHYRVSEKNRVFVSFRLYAISVRGQKPDLEPLSPEMEWWLKLDENWKNFFKEKFKLEDYPENYEIRKCQGLRELDVSKQPINNIDFLSNFLLLEKLDLSKTNVKDLKPLKDLKNLKELNIADTKVDTLLYLRDLKNLTLLDVSGLGIYSLEDIAGLDKMVGLSVGGNKLKSLEPLRNMEFLMELDISLNYFIKDVEPITGLVNLEKLKLRKVEIGSLEPLTNLVNLVYLDCYNAGISDLSPIKRLPKIMHLDISHNSIESIGPLRSLNYVTYLALASTKVSDLSPISGYRHLEYLNISGNPQLKSISAVPNETLNTFVGHYTGLSSGDVQRFKKRNPKCKITYY